MSLSQSSATNCVPLLARIVLGAAFITAGWGKFETIPFSGDQLKTLQDMGLADASANHDATIMAASLIYQDASGGGQDTGEAQDTGGEDEATGDENQDEDVAENDTDTEEVVEQPDTGADTVAGDTPVQMRQLYSIATQLKDTPLEPYAYYLAWGAAITELAGGGLILIGLFSRLWGLGLSVVMGTAFYLTSLEILGEVDFNLFNLDMDGDYQHIFLQVALLALAFGVFLTGPGALSVDRLLFKGGNGDEHADVDLT